MFKVFGKTGKIPEVVAYYKQYDQVYNGKWFDEFGGQDLQGINFPFHFDHMR